MNGLNHTDCGWVSGINGFAIQIGSASSHSYKHDVPFLPYNRLSQPIQYWHLLTTHQLYHHNHQNPSNNRWADSYKYTVARGYFCDGFCIQLPLSHELSFLHMVVEY